MKKAIALALSAVMLGSVIGCSGNTNKNEVFTAAMVTDTGGVNDQSFNHSAWEGLQAFSENTGAKVSYLESNQATDYITNMNKLADQNCDLIWGIGFAMADSVAAAAEINLDIHYAIADNSYGDETLPNVTGVMFRAQESSFLAGYVAGKTTKTDAVGFVGGIAGAIIDQFEYGYTAGVQYAAKELGKDIRVSSQYVESFSDATKGKATASKMISDGCDVVFHAAGGAGVGVIEAAKEANKFAIGVDRDQAYLAPNNVLTSALKNVGKAVEIVSIDEMNGKEVGGQTLTYGLKEDCVGLPESNPNMDPAVYEAAMEVQQKIIDGQIVPPQDKASFDAYLKTL